MHKTLFAIAAIIASGGYFVQSLGSAHAVPSGPSVHMGEQPWRSFTGHVNDTGVDLIDIPDDRAFIVTTFVAHQYINVYQGSTMALEGNTGAASSTATALSTGNGHMVIAAGTSLQIRNAHSSSDYPYYIEGYFVRP